jgi:OmpA-OmpF porin, OOP family
MLNGKKLALATSAMVFVLSTTHAQEVGPYIGAGIGGTKVNVNEGPFFEKDDDWNGSWSLTGGYRLTTWLAVEAGYADLGTLKFHSDTSVPGVFDVDSEFKIKGFTAAVVGTLPLSSAFDLHGRVGALFSDTDTNIRFPNTGFRQSFSGSDEDLFYGAGVGWHVNENWSLSLDYERYQDVGEEGVPGEGDVDSVGIHAFFNF